jgi:hypothetical protein
VRRFAVLLLAALLTAPLSAPPAEAARKKLLWATVNACDTIAHPNAIGLRASMPGNGTRQRMYVRFTAQYKDTATGKWKRVPGVGRSSWVKLGSARVRARQAGWTFTIGQPPAGASFTLRGRVDFRWKARHKRRHAPDRWVVVKHRHRFTRGGLTGVDGGDPPGASQASCTVR